MDIADKNTYTYIVVYLVLRHLDRSEIMTEARRVFSSICMYLLQKL